MKALHLPLYLLLLLPFTNAVVLAQETKDLKTVVITGSKPVVKQEADRLVYDLQADPDNKSSNLIEIMRKIPFLSVDVNDNLLFRGQSDFRVFINGKPSSMMDRNLKEVLRTMPASTIQKIEVITNPSSKYDAEGLAGIINIITVKAGFQGYSGTLNFSERHPLGGPNIGSSFNYKLGRIGISAYAGASQFNRPATQSYTERISGLGGTSLMQNSSLRTRNPGGYIGTEFSFEIDTLNLLSAQLNVNGSRTKEYRDQLSTLNEGSTLLQEYRTNNLNRAVSKGWDGSLNYQIGFRANKDRLLTFSYRYLTYQNKLNSDVEFSERYAFSTPDYVQENNGNMNEHTLQADYVQKFNQVSMEAGVKWIARRNGSEFRSLMTEDATRPGLANSYRNDQQVWAVYNSYQFKLMDWTVKIGMRLESTMVDVNFDYEATQVNQQYLNFIPNVAAGRKVGKTGNLNIGFAQRIKRPGINKLNPFVDRSNPAFEVSGNPDLKPSLINSIMVGYGVNSRLAVNMGLNYSWVKSLFVQVSAFNTETQITRTTHENTGKAQALDADLNLRYAITKAWNASVNLHGTYMLMEALNDGTSLSNNWFFYNVSFTTGYNLRAGWRVTAGLDVKSRNMVNLQGTSNGYVASSFGINKDILKNKLSFSATINNAFTKYRANFVETTGPNFLQTSSTQDYFRNYNVSLNYRFGKLKEGIKKSKRSINNDDLSN